MAGYILITSDKRYGSGHLMRATHIIEKLRSYGSVNWEIIDSLEAIPTPIDHESKIVIDVNLHCTKSRLAVEDVAKKSAFFKKIIYIDNLQLERPPNGLRIDSAVIPYPVRMSYVTENYGNSENVYSGLKNCGIFYAEKIRRQNAKKNIESCIYFTTGSTDEFRRAWKFLRSRQRRDIERVDIQLGMYYSMAYVAELRKLKLRRSLRKVNLIKWKFPRIQRLSHTSLAICSPGLTQYEHLFNNIPFLLNSPNKNTLLDNTYLRCVNRSAVHRTWKIEKKYYTSKLWVDRLIKACPNRFDNDINVGEVF